MTPFHTALRRYTFGTVTVQLLVPDPQQVRVWYETTQPDGEPPPFPYWARVWPAALAMSTFLAEHQEWLTDRRVLELAAGLGLPGLVAASFAREVTISDYLPDAVALAGRSAAASGLENVHCRQIDWNTLPDGLSAEVLLLSDINYDPSAFETLYGVLLGFLRTGTTVILTTPQRLMARPFIERLLPFCTHQEEIAVTCEQMDSVFITLLILQIQEPDPAGKPAVRGCRTLPAGAPSRSGLPGW